MNKRWLGSVPFSRVFPYADCGSDHQLVMAGMKLKLKKKRPPKRIRKFNVGRLRDEDTNQNCRVEVERLWKEHMTLPIKTIEEEWSRVSDIIHTTSEKVLGYQTKERRSEWISNSTRTLMEERRFYKCKRKESATMAKHHNYLCRLVKKNACTDREEYIKEICLDVEMAGMQNKTKAVYEGVRKITGKHSPQVKSVKAKMGRSLQMQRVLKQDGKNTLTSCSLYNDPNDTSEDILKDFPDAGNREPIPSIGEDEVKTAISRMKQRKAPGVDSITVEEIAAARQHRTRV